MRILPRVPDTRRVISLGDDDLGEECRQIAPGTVELRARRACCGTSVKFALQPRPSTRCSADTGPGTSGLP